MPRHLRFQSHPWATHHVTSRCLRGFAFLKPTPQIKAICAGTLAYSLDTYKDRVELHHLAFLSNHLHLLVSTAEANDLARFMCHFKSNLARELCKVHGWSDVLWEGRYFSEEILDEEALRDIFKYITQNSVKEGLVAHPSEWGGLHGYHHLVEGKPLVGPWVNRSKLNASKKLKNPLKEADVTTMYHVELTPPPMWAEMSREDYQALCQGLSEEAIREAQALCNKTAPMGMKRVLAQRVIKARKAKGGKRPLCRASCLERFKAYLQEYFEFRELFLKASAELRAAVHSSAESVCVCFPYGGVPLFGGEVLPAPS